MVQFGNSWDNLLQEEFEKEYYPNLREFIKNEYSTKTVYPDMYDIFNALKYTDYNDVKAVILGQDPYHGPGQAHGLAFSVRPGVKPPPSLCNMYKELYEDLGIPISKTGCLIPWAKQGVLLLNAVLTVQAGCANSHKGKGWEVFTDKVISLLNEREKPIVFLLWGNPAQKKKELITNPIHHILAAPHPSPLSASRGFFGCKHFSKANSLMEEPIDWTL